METGQWLVLVPVLNTSDAEDESSSKIPTEWAEHTRHQTQEHAMLAAVRTFFIRSDSIRHVTIIRDDMVSGVMLVKQGPGSDYYPPCFNSMTVDMAPPTNNWHFKPRGDSSNERRG